MTHVFWIDQAVLQRMVHQAERESPLECCGLLAGSGNRIFDIVECRNELASCSAFSIPAEELFQSFRRFRDRGQKLLGVYHSHPSAPVFPSARDLEECFYRDVSYWIISLLEGHPVVGCFCWTRNGFVESQFRVNHSVRLPTAE